MQNILYIPEQSPSTSAVLDLLEKRGLLYTETPLCQVNVKQAFEADCFLYIIDIAKEIRRSLEFVGELRNLALLSGRKCAPLLFVVAKNIEGFEHSARCLPIDFYCPAPVEERYFYHAIAQALMAA